jgi:hypothetical protein
MKNIIKKTLSLLCLVIFCLLIYSVNTVFWKSIQTNMVKKYGIKIPGKIISKKFVPRNDPENSSAYNIKYQFMFDRKKIESEALIQSEYYPISNKEVRSGDIITVFILNNNPKTNVAEFTPSLTITQLLIIILFSIIGNAFGIALVIVFFDISFDAKLFFFLKRHLGSRFSNSK